MSSTNEQPNTIAFSRSMDQYLAKASKAESPAAERNKQPILEVLQKYLQPDNQGHILEVASGSGQHVSYFARSFPRLHFYPTDLTDELFPSICAYCEDLPNVRLPPNVLDVSTRDWPHMLPEGVPGYDAMIAVNVTHISPWPATLGLLAGAGKCLRDGGLLFLYGPFKKDGVHTSEGNVNFDISLKARNPEWGYRDTADVVRVAGDAGLELALMHDMPANNFMLVFKK